MSSAFKRILSLPANVNSSVRYSINTLRPRRNGQHFAHDIFKRVLFHENVWISIRISLKFVTKGPINNIPALVQIMVWRRSATSHYLNQWWLVYWRPYASLGLNELPVLAWPHALDTNVVLFNWCYKFPRLTDRHGVLIIAVVIDLYENKQ